MSILDYHLISLKIQQRKLPKSPGVYLFLNEKDKVIYIGKATILRTRVASYLRSRLDIKTQKLIKNTQKIEYKTTETTLEALFLEASLIKKFQPKYNIKQKDDKTSAFLIITDEKFPRLKIKRPNELNKEKIKQSFGPFKNIKELEDSLKILRKIFPYHSDNSFKKPCFHYQIGMCPGPCANKINAQEYKKNIKNLVLIFDGKKNLILKKIERKMQLFAKQKAFEKAIPLRNILSSLKNHLDINLSQKNELNWKNNIDLPKRLEAYDISNLFNKFSVGSMVVFSYGRKNKMEYRHFKIKWTKTQGDIPMLKEILKRRFRHCEWERPSAIFIDGGINQLRGAEEVLKTINLRIPIFSAAKGPDRKGFRIFKTHKKFPINNRLLREASLEAHRFAINYHRKLRRKNSTI